MSLAMLGVRPPGAFCWFNVLTPSTAEARAFFAAVLRWSYTEIPGMGHLVHASDGRPVGGLFDVVSPQTPQGTAPSVTGMIKVDSVDEACDRVRAAGGTVARAFDIQDRLRMALCSDPHGIKADLFQAKADRGTEADATAPGAPVLYALRTPDVAGAAAFYAAAFGWASHSGAGSTDGAVTSATFTVGPWCVARATLVAPPAAGAPAPGWTTFFTVADAAGAVAHAVALGGTVSEPLAELDGFGRRAELVSPQGVPFGVLELAPAGPVA